MDWDHSVDVLVMGSGGAGQTAALRACDLGLDVLVVEKGDTWGGSTAMSAGAVWLPNNRAMKEARPRRLRGRGREVHDAPHRRDDPRGADPNLHP